MRQRGRGAAGPSNLPSFHRVPGGPQIVTKLGSSLLHTVHTTTTKLSPSLLLRTCYTIIIQQHVPLLLLLLLLLLAAAASAAATRRCCYFRPPNWAIARSCTSATPAHRHGHQGHSVQHTFNLNIDYNPPLRPPYAARPQRAPRSWCLSATFTRLVLPAVTALLGPLRCAARYQSVPCAEVRVSGPHNS